MKLIHLMLSGLALGASMLAGPSTGRSTMEIGNFSVSLAVKDIEASKAFYEKLGFVQFGGDVAQKWVILKNGATNIGLFQGMFDKNALTFNPGWDHEAKPDGKAQDIRVIQQRLNAAGVDTGAAIESPSGPGSFMLTDPDGNPILFDQHL